MAEGCSESEWRRNAAEKELAEWQTTNRFCGKCGAAMSPHANPAERAMVCPECGYTAYPAIAPSVIVLVTNGDKILLQRNTHYSGVKWSLAAGFVEPGETLEDAIRREAKEESGIDLKDIRYASSQAWPFPSTIMVGFRAEYAGGELHPDGNGMMKIKGGAFDEERSQCRTEERGNARDPSQGYHNVGFRILRTKNHAASVLQNAQAANWILRNVENGASLTAADWRELEKDPDADGVPTWAEYVALTDPNDADSRFAAAIAIAADGTPTIGWNTQTYASRKYTVYGKVNLSDSVWLEVNGNESTYRFFKVNVELK